MDTVISNHVTSTNLAVFSTDTLEVESGATVISTIVDGTATIGAGGVASDTFVHAGGGLIVLASGSASDTFIRMGGTAQIAGSAFETTIDSGGVLVLSATGFASGGAVEIDGGVSAAGIVDGMSDAGQLDVLNGGSASGVVVLPSGAIDIESDAAATGTILKGGLGLVFDSATAGETFVRSGGVLETDGASLDARISRGGEELDYGNSISAVVLPGGEEVDESIGHVHGTVSGTIVESGGELVFSRNASAFDLHLRAGAEIFVEITSAQATISNGAIYFLSRSDAPVQSAFLADGGIGLSLTSHAISLGLTEFIVGSGSSNDVKDGGAATPFGDSAAVHASTSAFVLVALEPAQTLRFAESLAGFATRGGLLLQGGPQSGALYSVDPLADFARPK